MNASFIEFIYRCRRRILLNLTIMIVMWWVTIALAGIVFSYLISQGVLIPVCLTAGIIAAYYYYKRVPANGDIVNIIDNNLSLKEGLITAYQYREDLKISDSFVSPLINQITLRLNVSRPDLLFPLSFPKVLLIWPLLIIILFFSRGLKNFASVGTGNNSIGINSSLREDVNNPMNPEESGKSDSVDSDLSTGSFKTINPHPHLNPLPEGEEISPSLKIRDRVGMESSSDVTIMNGAFTKDNDNPPLTRGGDGGVFSSENNHAGTPASEKMSSISGINAGKITSKGKEMIVSGRGSGKNNLSTELPATELPDGYGKWEAGKWMASYTDAMHVLIQQDIPDDYKDYLKSYFDAVQKEEQVNGR